MRQSFVGFYWTLPVKWVGLHRLPQGSGQKPWDLVDEAAAVSRTIRYQRERVSRWVEDQGGKLRREFVFMELQPDRMSSTVSEVLDVLAPLCARRGVRSGAQLVSVDFALKDGASSPNWRRHRQLQYYIETHQLDHIALSPDPVIVPDARFDPCDPFDPIVHFRRWRRKDTTARSKRNEQTQPSLALLFAEVPSGRGRYAIIAEQLNEKQIKTRTGKDWTAENVRVAAKRLGLID